jgi:Transcriptional regulator
MTLLSYQVFKTVADHGSFRKAADILGLTPSAISHTIASLENELGFSVLNRSKAGVTLTNYGEHLLPYVNAVLNSDESLQQAIAEFNGLKQGKVKVGCFSSVCTNWLPDIMHSFQMEFPKITIEVFQGTYDDVVYWLKNGIVDLGFLSVSSSGDIPIEPLYKDPLLCVVPKGMKRITDNEYMEIGEMRTYQFVTQRESTDADIQNFLKENSLDVQSNYHVVDDLSTIAMVAHGFGICLMPEMVMADIPYEVDCYLVKPEAYRIIGIAVMHPEFMAPAVRTMYNHILNAYRQPDICQTM